MAVRQSFRRLNGVYLPFALVTPIYNSDDYRLYISFEVSISSIYFFLFCSSQSEYTFVIKNRQIIGLSNK